MKKAVKPGLQCGYCGFILPEGKRKCPSCKNWVWSSAASADESVAFEHLKETKLERLKTGLFDSCIGGGIPRTFVLLIAGLPGAGKSTALMQVAECLCHYGEVLYLACEEDVGMIIERGQRLGLQPEPERFRFIQAMGGVSDIGSLLMARRPNAIIIDSIDSMCGHDDNLEIQALMIIKKYAVELKSVVIVISRVNKAGDFSGLEDKQHEVDICMTLMPEEELEPSENGERIRVAQTRKNRGGVAWKESFFEMTEKGLREYEPSDNVDERT